MNPVLITTHNCLELTKRCVESVRKQDIPVHIIIFDDDSTDGTREWIESEKIDHAFSAENVGVTYAWNYGLDVIWKLGYTQCLVLNNDVSLPPWFYRMLLDADEAFISGAEVRTMEELIPPVATEVISHPDFSAFMITKEAWEKIGPFDSRFWGWCNDCDYHIRGHQAGVLLWGSNILYYHERSSTIKTATPKEQRSFNLRADADRQEFVEKYGFEVGSPGYDAAFAPEKFEKNRIQH